MDNHNFIQNMYISYNNGGHHQCLQMLFVEEPFDSVKVSWFIRLIKADDNDLWATSLLEITFE